MKWVTCVEGSLHVREDGRFERPTGPAYTSDGFADALAPKAVHELLFDARVDAPPLKPAVAGVRAAMGITSEIQSAVRMRISGETPEPFSLSCLPEQSPHAHCSAAGSTMENAAAPRSAWGAVGSRQTVGQRKSVVVWLDPHGTLYPPALAAAGVPLDRLYVLRVRPNEVAAVATDCLRCPGVAVVVAPLPAEVSRVQARRLQLAAEHGGGVGIVLREFGRGSDIYAAATRWRVTAAPGDFKTQRWAVCLAHGRVPGRSIGETFWLETPRASTDEPLVSVHPPAPLADHAPPAARAAAAR